MIAGNGTDVGNTWVACRLVKKLRSQGVEVAARKPAQSYAVGDDPASTDAALLARTAGCSAEEVCPATRSYEVALAPPMAAEALW